MPKEAQPQADPFRPDTTTQGGTPGVHKNADGHTVTTRPHGESESSGAVPGSTQKLIDDQGIIYGG